MTWDIYIVDGHPSLSGETTLVRTVTDAKDVRTYKLALTGPHLYRIQTDTVAAILAELDKFGPPYPVYHTVKLTDGQVATSLSVVETIAALPTG